MLLINFNNSILKENIADFLSFNNIEDIPDKITDNPFTYDDKLYLFHDELRIIDQRILDFNKVQFSYLNVHPDLTFMFSNNIESPILSYIAYFSIYNKYPNKFINKFTNLDFNMTIGGMSLNEYDFKQYQDLMKNLFTVKVVTNPSFITSSLGNDEESWTYVSDGNTFNAYEVLGFKPLTYNDLLNLEGTQITLNSMTTFNHV